MTFMRRLTFTGWIFALPGVVLVAGCGGQSADVASTSAATSPAPSPSSSSSSSSSSATPTESSETPTPTPTPTGALFVDVVEVELDKFNALIGQPTTADLTGALPLFDGSIPLPAGDISGAGYSMDSWQGRVTDEQMIGLDTKLTGGDLEKFGGGVPEEWKFNSISTTDTSATLVATRTADGLRLGVSTYAKPDPGEPVTQVRLETTTDAIAGPDWIATLPALEGGEISAVGEGVGEVLIDYFPAGKGLVTVRWRYEGDRLQEIQDYLMSGALEVAGFDLVDPDAIRIGASAFDVQAGDWMGEVIVGTTEFEGQTLTDLVWFLQKE